ncbi:YolD-like family protein [Alicyclobacillus macrosporangiidus]|uniref:YolD-like protein n=1 Tax=Alicyclobacillus macrosporangiidus TaxID=392015 RepID=A0A1I7KBG6_9BACL|nr:YolD-like family protein [Alicyclobacillus macrosporangiidus]SFU94748.1 YolD-like protein [Alicyclobacillus macrosporangiidus]
MTSIRDGNIFEAMRILLPEHRATTQRYREWRSRRRPPELSADELSEMQYKLSEAIELRRPVRLVLFHPDEDVVIMGVPELKGGRLWLWRDDGNRVLVDCRRLMRVETRC